MVGSSDLNKDTAKEDEETQSPVEYQGSRLDRF